MANALYTPFKTLALGGDIDLANDDIRAILVDIAGGAGYVFSAAHDFLDDVPALARYAVSSALSGKSIAGGAFDAADVSWGAVNDNPTLEAIILYKHTGTDSTSPLIAYLDTGAGLPIPADLNSALLSTVWGANIFAL